MEKDNLINRVRKGFYTALAAGFLGAGAIYGCKDAPTEPIIKPPVDTPPRATTQSISPTSGMSPLEVRAQYTCTDDKGITEYRLTKGSRVFTKSSPIDTIVTFTETGTLGMSCKDARGQTASYGPMSINVTQPPVNNPPQTSLSISPPSGISPLEISVLGECTDLDDDIAYYRVMKGDSILTRTNPTDMKIMLNEGEYLFYSKCGDKAGNEVTSDTSYVEVTPPANNPP